MVLVLAYSISFASFRTVIANIYERHSFTLITMAKGAHEIKKMLKQDTNEFADLLDLQRRIEEFYMSRIGIRMVRSLF